MALFVGALSVTVFTQTVTVRAKDDTEKSNGEYRYKEVGSPYPYKVKAGDTFIECGDGICLIKYLGDAAEVVVPGEIDGKPVTVIDSGCFSGNETVTRVEIPESVTWLDGFNECSNLKDIKLSNGVKVIGVFAFENCTSLEKIDLPDSVICIGAGIKEGGAFARCSSLKEVRFSKNLREIGPNAFNYCKALEKVVLPEKVTWIRDYCFFGCSSLKEALLPANCKKIGHSAFGGCRSLEYVDLPDSVTNIMTGAFAGCSSLKGIHLSKNLQTIYTGAFKNCSALEEITIPNSVTDIGKMWMGRSGYAFSGCSSLKRVTIGGKIQALRRRTFERCRALESVKLPASVTKIGEGVFIGCESLETIRLPSGTERICIDAFRDCGLKEIIFPESVRMVGRRSFAHCGSLKKIVFKGKNAKIGSLAFKGIAKNAVFDVPNHAVSIYRSRLTKKNTGFAAKSMKVI